MFVKAILLAVPLYFRKHEVFPYFPDIGRVRGHYPVLSRITRIAKTHFPSLSFIPLSAHGGDSLCNVKKVLFFRLESFIDIIIAHLF